jgi:signal transduction histidine kinase
MDTEKNIQILEKKIQALEELLEINLFINSTLDLDLLLNHILNVSQRVLNAQAVSILLLDKPSGELFFRCALGPGSKNITPYHLKPKEGIAGTVIQNRAPIMVEDVQQDSRFAGRFDRLSGFTTRSLIAVPMWAKEEIIGVLELMNKNASAPSDEKSESTTCFTSDDLEKGGILANMAAVAIDNARLYQDLSRSFELLKKAEEIKTRFISIMSHELRTPLVPIKGFAYILKKERRKLDESSQNEFLAEILRASEHLELLIQDLFWVNDLEMDRFQPRCSPAPFIHLVQEAVLIKNINQTTHPLNVEIDPALLKKGDLILFVDPEKMTHLFAHTLDNAVKFSPEGGSIRIKASLLPNHEFQISIEDHGIGIPEEYREKVFERFFQIDNSDTRKFGGTGVGLFIVKRIAESHGGSVSCERGSEKGTKIVLHLPLSAISGPVQ